MSEANVKKRQNLKKYRTVFTQRTCLAPWGLDVRSTVLGGAMVSHAQRPEGHTSGFSPGDGLSLNHFFLPILGSDAFISYFARISNAHYLNL